ncbi:protein GRAVITROPIC IN THE LIGHT 1 [Henckelia pumila]|uniref:protein GRAVITROPIC IN THE LIGHT 1 n=1 Tax=Henckelia pumila TaxID=405737 RepID=UPI003C6E7B7E
MATKVSNFSDLIQRMTASSCLLHSISAIACDFADSDSENYKEEEDHEQQVVVEEKEEEEYENAQDQFNVNWEGAKDDDSAVRERVAELEMLMGQVFDAVSAVKRAYVSQQEAHCPWDPDKMRAADMAVVAELRRLGMLRERYRRSRGGGGRMRPAATLREVVAPYEAALEELKREVKAKQAEVDSLGEKLKTATSFNGGKSKGKSTRRVSCSSTNQVAAAPAVELLEATMSLVKEASKSFTSLLLSLMRSAHLDIAAAVRSIETASANATNNHTATITFMDSIVGANHAKYALESYVNRKMFQGFDHETFYMDGSLSSILNPEQHRIDCFTQYRDMKTMDPVELLSILPTCRFGNFCFKKYLSIIHPKMEESLFGDLEQRRQVLDGHHPRSQFYGEFSRLAKAVWLLHLLKFSFDPPPTHFEASKGADFHPQYMESVVRISGNGRGSMVVGFPVSPGFKIGNGTIIKARVYLVPKNG